MATPTYYYALTTKQANSEESFFKEITSLLLQKYNTLLTTKPTTKPTTKTTAKPTTTRTSSISINVTIPIDEQTIILYNYTEFNNWFTKANFKYTVHKTLIFIYNIFLRIKTLLILLIKVFFCF